MSRMLQSDWETSSQSKTTNQAFYRHQVEEFNENLSKAVDETREEALIFKPTYYSIPSYGEI
jgi:hypothetical protein